MRGRLRPYVWWTGVLLALAVLAFIIGNTLLVNKTTPLSLEIEPFLALPGSPLDVTVRVGDREVALRDGVARYREGEREYTLRVTGAPAFGDLTGNGVDDAAMLLLRDGLGSGDHFIVVALRDGGGYLGSNAVPIVRGDGVTLSVRDELVIASWEGSASARYFTTTGATLYEVMLEEGHAVVHGFFTYTNATRTFTTCGGRQLTLSDDKRSQAILQAVYQGRSRTAGDAVYVVLAGTVQQEGNDDSDVLLVSQVMSAPRDGVCPPALP